VRGKNRRNAKSKKQRLAFGVCPDRAVQPQGTISEWLTRQAGPELDPFLDTFIKEASVRFSNYCTDKT